MDNGNATGIFHIPIYTAKLETINYNDIMVSIEESGGWGRNDGGNFISVNKWILDEGNLAPLRGECEHHLNRFLTEVVKLKLKFSITQSWVNRNPKGSSHVEHTHRNSIWNCVMFLKDHPTPMIFRDPNPWKDFWDWDNETIEPNWANSNIVNIYPEFGKIVFFPHYLHHRVDTNMYDVERVSLAFNTWFDGDFGGESKLTSTKKRQ